MTITMCMRSRFRAVVLGAVTLAGVSAGSSPEVPAKNAHGVFTGEVKIVFYVQDVRKAVEFYTEALGFKFHHYFDHVGGGSVPTWTRDVPPIYAEMSYVGKRFGLHSPTSDADRKSVGAAKVYFRVKDLDAHHLRTEARGAKPSEIKRRSWMDIFHVVDPDGNGIYFAFTDDSVHGNPWYGS